MEHTMKCPVCNDETQETCRNCKGVGQISWSEQKRGRNNGKLFTEPYVDFILHAAPSPKEAYRFLHKECGLYLDYSRVEKEWKSRDSYTDRTPNLMNMWATLNRAIHIYE